MERRIRETRTGRWIVEVDCAGRWDVDTCLAKAVDSAEAARNALPADWDGEVVRLNDAQRAQIPAERERRNAAHQARRTAADAREIERLRAEAQQLLLTADGDECRDDVWNALHPYALKIAMAVDVVSLIALARQVSPVGASDLFVAVMEQELQAWLACVVDSVCAAE